MKVAVKNLENKSVGEIELSDDVFGIEPRADIINDVVNWQLAKRRSGTHKTKDVSEISGTGKKPHRQKGTGSARLGNKRGTQSRGGQRVHGPVVRDHGYAMPKKVRQLALKSALSAKQAGGKLFILDAATAKSHKTKDMAATFKTMGWEKALIIDGAETADDNFIRATNNIPYVKVLAEAGANVYDIMRSDALILTKEAAQKLEARLK